MARLPRLYAPGVPQLVQARFARPLAAAHEATPAAALELLHTWFTIETQRHTVALHGWALTPGQLVFMATPPHPHAISRAVQGLGRRMAAGMTHGRTFDGRYRSALVDDAWVPACLLWVESLPVRDGWVDTAARWPWSSAQEHVGLRPDTGLLTDHAAYWDMGNTPYARQAEYRSRLRQGMANSERERIERAVFGQWVLGTEDFIARVAPRCNRRALPAPPGRPRKARVDNTVTN